MRLTFAPTSSRSVGRHVGPHPELAYRFRLTTDIHVFRVFTLGLLADQEGAAEFFSEVYTPQPDNQFVRVPLRVPYITHEEAEAGHLNLCRLCDLAESQEELLELCRMANNVLGPEANIGEHSEDR